MDLKSTPDSTRKVQGNSARPISKLIYSTPSVTIFKISHTVCIIKLPAHELHYNEQYMDKFQTLLDGTEQKGEHKVIPWFCTLLQLSVYLANM